MATQQSTIVLRHVRTLAERCGCGGLTDGQLLERFATLRDGAAFTALVRRHGPLVLAVCRRVLARSHDAEDAFQATFFVLARKAGSIRKAESVASWLYGVAYRLAREARARLDRRRVREQVVADAFPERAMSADPADELCRREVRLAVDEELCRLPEKYRAPLLLCDLAGKSHAEAARELTWPPGTVKTRLAHARSLMRARLARRGLALSAAALAPAAVPPDLLAATAKSALAFAAGQAAGSFSPAAAALAQRGLNMLVLNKLKMAVVLSVMMGLLGAGSLALVHQAARAEVPAAPGAGPAAPAAEGAGAARTDRQGDPLPPGALARLGTTRLRHGGLVTFVAFLPGGKEVVSAGDDGTARLWDVATGKEVRRFGEARTTPAAPGVVFLGLGGVAAALSPDGKVLALGDGAVIRLWDVNTGKVAGEVTGRWLPVAGLAFAPDGKTLAAALTDGQVRLFDTGTRKEIRHFNDSPEGGPKTAANNVPIVFSPDGKALVTQSTEFAAGFARVVTSIKLWDVATGKPGRPVAVEKEESAHDPAFSPDGQVLAWATDAGTVVLTDAATGKELRRLKNDGPGRFAFAPDGKTVVTLLAGHRAGAVWDVATGKEVRRLGKPMERPAAMPRGVFLTMPVLAISPDGKRLASAGEDSTLTLWDLTTGRELHAFAGHQSSLLAVRFSPDGKTLTSRGGDGTVRTWDAATGKEIRQARAASEFGSLLSPDGRRLAKVAADGTLTVSDAATGKEQCAIKGAGQGGVELTFSPDGKTLAVSRFQDAVVHLYDLATGKEGRVLGDPDKAGPVAGPGAVITLAAPRPVFSPDGRLLAARAGERCRVWEVATGRELPQVEPPKDSQVAGIAFTPDSRSLALDLGDGGVVLWELATGKQRRQLGKPVKAESRTDAVWVAAAAVAIGGVGLSAARPSSVAVSPDGRTLARMRGHTVRVWDLLTGQELGELKGHQGAVTALEFAPDGKTLATGSGDTTALVWDIAALTGKRKPPAEPSARDLQAHWDALAGDDAGKALDAIAALAGAPKKALPLIRERVKPVAAVDAKQIEKLIADLDSDDFTTRDQASAALKKLGPSATPALKKALAGKPSAEVRRVVEELLRLAGDAGPASGELPALRAVEALEHMATPEARELLKALARGAPEARVTVAASSALERLGK
jgi:RNA polymerase sigma factor (sigma-70 family)